MASTVIAITGEVGAGKSTVSRFFAEELGELIDADAIVAELWRTERVKSAAAARWGGEIIDSAGNVIHSAVAKRAFSGDSSEYQWLNALLHPLVHTEIENRITSLADGFGIVEIPLFFESKSYSTRPSWLSSVVFVTSPREIRLRRCFEQRGWSDAELARRESFFLSSAKRIELSDYVIQNDGELDKLKKAVKEILNAVSKSGGGV